MKTTIFKYRGKVGHFLRAEANRSSLTYPVPPRTVLLGVIGAILGLGKDEPQRILKNAQIAISGAIPRTHWHCVKLRKYPPAPLSLVVTAKTKTSNKESVWEKAALIRQEWLWQPDFTVFAALPDPYIDDIASRIHDRRWHFTPSLGLSEMFADILPYGDSLVDAEKLLPGIHDVATVMPQQAGELDTGAVFSRCLALQSLRMPRDVTEDRVFTHASYYVERHAKPVPFNTSAAWRVGGKTVVFL
jgi:CRISPR-associated protein Cas5h